ncbi:hypothetical protein [Endozoicomonas sp. GU-1]|uniref:hypothetical protein n=1 Tax=Endozoicomonas sp. GU-1 TaxID=3009078 RepID=UPI0022B4872A|nr:hypothetical protein [Endozoicomonas sp. GU-1]WBA79567.1 hypothetical protein O2T12_14380 [Endozoicomonas sp. GU-1]
MSEPGIAVNNLANGTAGAIAITVSAQSSMAESFYRASFDQILNGQFNLVVSDILGLASIAVLFLNLFLTVKRDRKRKNDHQA